MVDFADSSNDDTPTERRSTKAKPKLRGEISCSLFLVRLSTKKVMSGLIDEAIIRVLNGGQELDKIKQIECVSTDHLSPLIVVRGKEYHPPLLLVVRDHCG